MVYRTLEGTLFPDGSVMLPPDEIPSQPVRIMVTIMSQDEDAALAELGDYAGQLSDYEESLARGEIQWQ